jgi:hypothetical protein
MRLVLAKRSSLACMAQLRSYPNGVILTHFPTQTRTTALATGKKLRRTKVIATIGPACDDEDTLRQMIDAGMDVATTKIRCGR